MSITCKISETIIKPLNDERVKFYDCNNVIEMTYSRRTNYNPSIKKIDKDNYVYIKSGEIKQFNHTLSKKDSIYSVKNAMRNARLIINYNCPISSNCKFLTLTYKENMTNTKKLYNDFHNFWKRKFNKLYQCEYIMAVEPQQRGAWHIHMICIFDNRAPFINENDVTRMWGHGFCKVENIDSCDNIGAYLTAYLTNIECDTSNKDNKSKKYIKGARLHLYPSGMNIFRYSKGIKKPVQETSSYELFKERLNDYNETYSQTKTIIDTETGFYNTISYFQFKKRSNDVNK